MLTIKRKLLNSYVLKYFANLQRAVCSGRSPQLQFQENLRNTSNDETPKTGYGEKEIFLLGPVDIRTPLPGNIGIPPLSVLCTDTISQLPKSAGKECEVTTSLLPEERYVIFLTQAAGASSIEKSLSFSSSLECIGHDCPLLLRKDFSELFPSRDVTAGNLTVITLCQKTKNDMSKWSENAEVERTNLESSFLTTASTICAYLGYYNYWADFIHPNTGKPNFDSMANSTMFETDLRYRHFGFTIEDLGCCRIIMHKDWGIHAFVGAIFTNAPVFSREVQNVLANHKL